MLKNQNVSSTNTQFISVVHRHNESGEEIKARKQAGGALGHTALTGVTQSGWSNDTGLLLWAVACKFPVNKEKIIAS